MYLQVRPAAEAGPVSASDVGRRVTVRKAANRMVVDTFTSPPMRAAAAHAPYRQTRPLSTPRR
ncbi:hypothetical protein BVI434_830011 [Burkholderia vietnamiensis]|nr:hypothetical protein BVI434_830011 [Burkholderia vietnamiensis]